MIWSRQTFLGIGMIVGGTVMLFAMAQQIDSADKTVTKTTNSTAVDVAETAPLTTDLTTEKKLLAQKQQERAARVATQEKQTQALLAAQEQAEAEALAKSQAENQRKVTKDLENAATEEVKSQPSKDSSAEKVAKAAPTSAVNYNIQSGDTLGTLAERYHVPLSVITQANGISTDTTLQVGQKLTIPSQSQIAKLKQDAKAAKKAEEDKRKQEEAQAKKSADIEQRLTEARKTVKETDAKGTFGVQVALATSQANADEVAEKLKAAGYEVKTSKTDRGVRVIVGPERGKVAALALKDKINNDPNVKTDNAWVLYWR